jgi:hypothetical protein
MANGMFLPAREGFLRAEINLNLATIKAALVRGYTYNGTHRFVSDITTAGGVIAATSAALGGKSQTNGVFDANDFSWSAVPTNASNHSVLLYQASAVGGGADVASTAQRVIMWIDTGTNLPIVPNGGDVNWVWENVATKIFALG